jgi:predicted nuclease of predicted toxin-antitoxin system
VMRFYLDEQLSATIAEIGRALGLDVTSAEELDRRGLSDQAQLEWATAGGRTIVTANRDDFITLNSRWIAEARPHAGILIVPMSMPTNQSTRIARALRAYADRHADAPTDFLFDWLR